MVPIEEDRMIESHRISLWQVFRLIIVVFFLYFIGDVFYRWDGYRYHSSLLEFLPNVALTSILWSFVAALLTLLLWVPYKGFAWCSKQLDWKIKEGHLLLFAIIITFLALTVWFGKVTVYPYKTSLQLKFAVFVCVISTAILFAWLLRSKTELINRILKLFKIIQQQITPLVWIFGLFILIAVFIVAQQILFFSEAKVVSRGFITDKERPNIILVTYDSLTARDMSVYGYQRKTTPFISTWAKEASLFTRAQASSNWTGPACSSLMTGKRVWTHQKYDPHIYGSPPVNSENENVALELKKNGYYTMGFVQNSSASVKALGMSNSFDMVPSYRLLSEPKTLLTYIVSWLNKMFAEKFEFSNWIVKKDFILGMLLNRFTGNIRVTEVPPKKVFDKFFTVFDKPEKPFFAWIHLLPPHDPYLAPKPYMGFFDNSSNFTTKKSIKRLQKSLQKQMSESIPRLKVSLQDKTNFRQADVSIFRSRYDEFIKYIDNTFKNFIDELNNRGLKNTIIILSSDHGESFEHGYFIHGGPFLYEQVTHIPLVIKTLGQKKGQIINSLVEQIDVPATILDFANIPVPIWMEGRSLVPLLQELKLPARPAFSMSFTKNLSRGDPIKKGTIAVWENEYKLIYYLEEKAPLLFNLKQDPDELNNLFDNEQEVGQRLLSLIHENLEKANEKISRRE